MASIIKGYHSSMWLKCSIIAGVIFFSQIACISKEPYGVDVQPQLEMEFKAIQSLPQSNLIEYSATSKTRQALVTGKYKTSIPYLEIKAHYEMELAKQGWKFYEEEEDWRFPNAKTTRYCKGEYRADLGYGYVGESWTYYFDVRWGLDSLVEEHSDKFRKVGCR